MQTSWSNTIFTNRADFTAHANSTSEVSLFTGGTNSLPALPAFSFDLSNGGFGKAFRFQASGVFSNTGTPTLVFTLRMGTTDGAAAVSGTAIATSAAITGASGVTNKRWEMDGTFICNTPGRGTGNATLSGSAEVWSFAGFASPFRYPMPDSGTWTATFDAGLSQYLNLTATWSAMSASNTITLKQCVVELLN
jgi:hypothetical protein